MRDPFAPIDVVSITDPAVSFDSPGARAEYIRTREPSLYRIAEGKRPAVFTVAPLASDLAIKLDHTAEYDRALLAFRACVHSVSLPSGEVLSIVAEPGFVLGSLAPVEWVRTVAKHVGVRRVEEIGEAAYRLSMMDDHDPLSPPPGQPPQS